MRGPGAAPPQRRRPLTFLEVPGGDHLTYDDAERRSRAMAAALVREHGVAKGDRVAVQAAKSPAYVLLYLACRRAGAVFLPMNTAYTAEEVAYLVDDSRPACVLDDAGLAELAAGPDADFDDVPIEPDDVAALLYTSGTTGRPKGAMLTRRNLDSNAEVLRRAWGFTADDVLLHVLPVFHAHGLFVAVNTVLAARASMVFLPRFDVDAVLAELPRCTVLMGVPTHYTRLLDDPRFDAEVCRNVRLFVSGSAPLLASTHEAFLARTGHAILERYGMTETVMLTSNPLEGERRPGTVGFPLPGTDLRLDDQGVIEVRGPQVFSGYWGRPELDETEFTADGFFRTGDIGSIDADGYVSIVGRAKDLVISGGLNVYPREVEEAVDALPGVLESAVIGVPDPDLGEAVVAVVVAAPGAVLEADDVRAAVRGRLAGFKVPKRVELVDELPRNSMGKVEKATLRRRFG